MGEENREPSLFFALISRLVRPQLFDKPILVRIRRCPQRRVLETDCDAIVPAGILGHVIRRRFDLHRSHPAGRDHFLQEWIVILQKQIEEFLLMSPLNLVIVLDDVRLIRPGVGRSPLSERKPGPNHKQRYKHSSHSCIPPKEWHPHWILTAGTG